MKSCVVDTGVVSVSRSFRSGLGTVAVHLKWVNSISLCPEVVKQTFQLSVLVFWASFECDPAEPEQREVENGKIVLENPGLVRVPRGPCVQCQAYIVAAWSPGQE